MPRKSCSIKSAEHALDYPLNIDPEEFVIWYNNDYVWPDPKRILMYLSNKRTHTLEGWAVFESDYSDAKTFPTFEKANAFLKSNEKLRGSPYTNIRVTAWKELWEIVYQIR